MRRRKSHKSRKLRTRRKTRRGGVRTQSAVTPVKSRSRTAFDFKTPAKTPTKTSKTPRAPTKAARPPPMPVVFPTEGEDVYEAHLSLLIALAGSSCCDDFIELMNEEYDIDPAIAVIKVDDGSKPSAPSNRYFVRGRPAIFYGSKATHFTCTLDGTRDTFVNSYTNGFQMPSTDHFCQTFAMMMMLNSKIPNTQWGRALLRLTPGHYAENAMIAKNYACDIMRYLNDRIELKVYLNDVSAEHDIARDFTIERFLDYCEAITQTNLCEGSFKTKIFNCMGGECNRYTCV